MREFCSGGVSADISSMLVGVCQRQELSPLTAHRASALRLERAGPVLVSGSHTGTGGSQGLKPTPPESKE